jgi:hypothetical protein
LKLFLFFFTPKLRCRHSSPNFRLDRVPLGFSHAIANLTFLASNIIVNSAVTQDRISLRLMKVKFGIYFPNLFKFSGVIFVSFQT